MAEPIIPLRETVFMELVKAIRETSAATERRTNAEADATAALVTAGPLLRELLDRRAADDAARVVAAREEGHRAGVEEGLRRAARAVEDERRRQIADLVSGSVDVVRKYVGSRVGVGLLVAALSALAGWFGVDVMAKKAPNTVEVGDAAPPGP